MNNRYLIASLVLILAILACNLPSNTPAAQSSDQPVITLTSSPGLPSDTPIPSATALPTDTPLPTLTPTPTIPIAWPSDKGVNCRFGPGTDWLTIGSLLVGQTATISGKNDDSSWWYVTTPGDPGRPCWVASSVTITAGNLANIPIISPPNASVTNVSVKLDPREFSLPGCMGPLQPITIKGTIETNGPGKVKYYFKTEQGGDMTEEITNFKSAGTKIVETTYSPSPSAGSYWVRLIITSPNNMVGEANYKIACP